MSRDILSVSSQKQLLVESLDLTQYTLFLLIFAQLDAIGRKRAEIFTIFFFFCAKINTKKAKVLWNSKVHLSWITTSSVF